MADFSQVKLSFFSNKFTIEWGIYQYHCLNIQGTVGFQMDTPLHWQTRDIDSAYQTFNIYWIIAKWMIDIRTDHTKAESRCKQPSMNTQSRKVAARRNIAFTIHPLSFGTSFFLISIAVAKTTLYSWLKETWVDHMPSSMRPTCMGTLNLTADAEARIQF